MVMDSQNDIYSVLIIASQRRNIMIYDDADLNHSSYMSYIWAQIDYDRYVPKQMQNNS